MQKKIADLLSAKGIQFISTIEHHQILSSTNDRVKEIFQTTVSSNSEFALKTLPCLVLADEQTAGRGRGGKLWWSGRGALLFSLGIELSSFSLTRNDLPRLSLATGFAVLQTIRPVLPSEFRVGLHWPNDVYIDDKKICGILIESPKPNLAVIGIGINVNNRFCDIPKDFQSEFENRPITSLIEIVRKKTDALEVLACFVRNFQHHIENCFFSDAWLQEAEASCIQVGRDIRIRQDARWIRGHCLGIAPDASLLVRTESGTETVQSGIVQ